MLAVARLRYEQQDFTGALEAYALVKLPELDPGRATLYLEEAWTRYQLGQMHAAMGLLTTLDAPSFREEFLPDKYLLRALIYRDLCHYLPAKRAAKELTRKYAESLEAIREREDLTKDPRLLRAASARGRTKRARQFLESLELEGEQLGRYAGSFGDRMFGYMTRLYDLAHAEATRVYQRAAARVGARRGRQAPARGRAGAADGVRGGPQAVRAGEEGLEAGAADRRRAAQAATQVAFLFVDEYWNDELRDYRFSLKSRCIEETAQ